MNIRLGLLTVSLLALGACSATYSAPPPTLDEQRRLADFIGTRAAGPPTRCISYYSGMQIQAVGDKITAQWGGRKWVNQVQGSCRMADSMSNTLVTESSPAGQYCENDTFKVVSNSGGMIMGSCMLGPWVPYNR